MGYFIDKFLLKILKDSLVFLGFVVAPEIMRKIVPIEFFLKNYKSAQNADFNISEKCGEEWHKTTFSDFSMSLFYVFARQLFIVFVCLASLFRYYDWFVLFSDNLLVFLWVISALVYSVMISNGFLSYDTTEIKTI